MGHGLRRGVGGMVGGAVFGGGIMIAPDEIAGEGPSPLGLAVTQPLQFPRTDPEVRGQCEADLQNVGQLFDLPRVEELGDFLGEFGAQQREDFFRFRDADEGDASGVADDLRNSISHQFLHSAMVIRSAWRADPARRDWALGMLAGAGWILLSLAHLGMAING